MEKYRDHPIELKIGHEMELNMDMRIVKCRFRDRGGKRLFK